MPPQGTDSGAVRVVERERERGRGHHGSRGFCGFFFFFHHRQREQSMDASLSPFFQLSPTTSSCFLFSHRTARALRAPKAPGRETPGRARRRCAPSRATCPGTDGAAQPLRRPPRPPRAGARAPRRRAPTSPGRWPRSWASPGGRRAPRASRRRRRGAGTCRALPRATRRKNEKRKEGRSRWLRGERGWERARAMLLLLLLLLLPTSRRRIELRIVRRTKKAKGSASSPRRRAGASAPWSA